MRFSNYEVMVAQGVWETGDGEPKKGQILRPAQVGAERKP
jgi:hypothetical protein